MEAHTDSPQRHRELIKRAFSLCLCAFMVRGLDCFTVRPVAATKSRFFAALRMTCHADPALREKDLLFFAPRHEVGQ